MKKTGAEEDLSRKGKLLSVLTLTVIMAGLAILRPSSGAAEQRKRFQTSFLDLFDTVTAVTGYEESEEAFTERAQQIHAKMETYDHLYDIYQEYPDTVNLCTINRHPGEVWTVDQRVIDLLLFAREADLRTNHRVNAMFGAVLRLWHEARENGISHPESAELPGQAALEAAAEHTGFDLIEIDPENRTVCLKDAQAGLDVGALAKGFAAQRVSEGLPEGYLLSVGGNVVATGLKPDGSAWVIGIQDPDSDGENYLQKISLTRGSVVTSGDYQRYYLVDGVRYAHIIDPETLFPGIRWRSVTIYMPDSGWADVLSTALFLMDQQEGRQLLESFGAEAMWVDADGNIQMSSGFEAQIR